MSVRPSSITGFDPYRPHHPCDCDAARLAARPDMTAARHAGPAMVALLVALSIPAATGGLSGAAVASHAPPTADAGPDQVVPVGSNVTLDATGSIDVSHSYSYVWVLVDNPGNDELEGDETLTPTFTPSTTGTYRATVTVIDAQGRTDSDSVTIEVVGTAAGRPTLNASLGTDTVRPDERTNLSVTLLNRGTIDLRSIDQPAFTDRLGTARGLNVSIGGPDSPLRVRTGHFGIGSLADGDATTLSVPVVVNERVRPGTYRVPVNVSYAYTPWIDRSGNETTERADRTLSVDLTVDAAPRFRVGNVSSALRVNDTDTVQVTLENVGHATATDTTVRLSSSNPAIGFGTAGAATRFVGRWPAGETRTVAFEATATDTAVPQPYPLAVAVTWDDGDDVHSQTQTVGVEPLPEGSFSLEFAGSTLAVDSTGRVTGRLTNTGDEPVENVVVSLTDRPQTFVPRTTEQLVGSLDPGETAPVDFAIDVRDDASAGPHQLGVVARYRTADDTQRQSARMDLRATVEPKRPAFRVSADRTSIVAGETGPFTLSVTNTADTPYRDVTVQAFPGGPLTAPDDQAAIPVIEPGETATVDLTVSAATAPAPRTYALSLDVRYDSEGETRIAGTYRVPVTVASQPDDGGSGFPLGLIAAAGALAVGLAWYGWRRRRQ